MSYSVKGKTALVTGANRGIGKALVEALIAQGVKRVYAAGRDLPHLKELQALAPTVIVPLQLDVTCAEDIARVAEQLEHLDILINNAGIATGSTFSGEASLGIADAEMATNYFGPVHLTHAFLPQLRQSSAAAVINVSSIAGISNLPSLGPYSASKAAVHSFTQGLRAELRGIGALVIGVYPGPVDTRLAKDFEFLKAQPADVAAQVLDGLQKGEEDIFPDAFSQAMYQLFTQNPKHLEKQFAQMAG